MNNPLGLVDPNGMAAEVYITGEDANKAAEELQKETPNIKITRDEKTGKLSYTGEAKTDAEKALVNAIDDEFIVNITTTSDHVDNFTQELFFGGSFRGSGNQTININDFPSLSKIGISSIGKSIGHEIIEAHSGAKLAFDISEKLITPEQAFDISHNEALKVFPDNTQWKAIGLGKYGWQVTNKESNQSVFVPFTSNDKEVIYQRYGKK